MLLSRVDGKWKSVRWMTEDGYIFKFKRKLKIPNLVFMKCVTKECGATCRVKFNLPYENNPENGEIIEGKMHTQGLVCRDPKFAAVERLRKRILTRAAVERKELSLIFQEEINRAPVEIRNELNFAQMERSMQRANKSSNPGTPRTLVDFAQLLELWKDKFGTVNNEQFFLGLFGTGDEECLIAKVSPIVNSPDFDRNAQWHLDGTFKCRPKTPNMCQLYVIMSTQFGRAVPIIWALMTKRTTKAYDVLFETVKQNIPGINPTIIMGDYEKAVRASLQNTFPTSTHAGCWFHFSQAIERKAKKIGIPCGGTGDGQIIAKRLMATALLPYEKVEEAVSLLEAYSMSLNEHAKAKLLIGYFKKEWIQKVTPRSFSVYGQNDRTNNCQESLNRRINKTIRPQGNPWDFWIGLQSISVKEINNFNHMKEGLTSARKKRNTWLLQDHNIKTLQEKLVRGEMSIEQFLAAASCRIVPNGQPNPNVYEHDENEDDVDTELATLDVLAGNTPQPSVATTDQAAGPETAVLLAADQDDVPFRGDRDRHLENYMLVPTVMNIGDMADVPSREFVVRQRTQLVRNLSEREEMTETALGERPCTTCITYKSTRVFSPCGHRAGCVECCVRFVNTLRYFTSIRANGEHQEEFNFPLPFRCHQCHALVGRLMRLFD